MGNPGLSAGLIILHVSNNVLFKQLKARLLETLKGQMFQYAPKLRRHY